MCKPKKKQKSGKKSNRDQQVAVNTMMSDSDKRKRDAVSESSDASPTTQPPPDKNARMGAIEPGVSATLPRAPPVEGTVQAMSNAPVSAVNTADTTISHSNTVNQDSNSNGHCSTHDKESTPASEIGSDAVDVSNSVQVNQAPASEPMVVSYPVDAPINIDNFSPSQTHTATPNDIQQSHFIPMSAPVNDYNNPTQSILLDCRQFVAMFTMALRDPVVQALYREVGITDNVTRAELKACKSELAKLKSEYNDLYLELEELKKYQRRNALRVINPNLPENDDEDTGSLILALCHEFKIPMRAEDISRSHMVGKKHPERPRAILVKFVGYRPRERLFKAKRDIRDKYSTIQINEDLTAATNELAYLARCEKRSKSIKDTWVIDGKVFVKAHQYSKPEVVKSKGHLSHICSNIPSNVPTFAEVVPQTPTSGNTPGPSGDTAAQSATSDAPLTNGRQNNMPPQPGTGPNRLGDGQGHMLLQPLAQSYVIPGNGYFPEETPSGATRMAYELNPPFQPPTTAPNIVQQQQLSAQYAAALHLAPAYSLPPPWTYHPPTSLPRYGEPSTGLGAGSWLNRQIPIESI